jgi:hypothetical protein
LPTARKVIKRWISRAPRRASPSTSVAVASRSAAGRDRRAGARVRAVARRDKVDLVIVMGTHGCERRLRGPALGSVTEKVVLYRLPGAGGATTRVQRQPSAGRSRPVAAPGSAVRGPAALDRPPPLFADLATTIPRCWCPSSRRHHGPGSSSGRPAAVELSRHAPTYDASPPRAVSAAAEEVSVPAHVSPR